jgi:anti-sigma factor RsiW
VTRRSATIREIDLLAYADGLLEADVVRKEEVEHYLATHPEAAAYVAEVWSQNEDIRAHYGPLLYEPVPEHLSAALHTGSRHTAGRRLAQAAAAIALMAAASLGGWLIGQSEQPEQWGLADFVERAAGIHHVAGADAAAGGGTGQAMMQPLGWLNQRIDLELSAPDLAAYGFSLVAKERHGPNSDPLVRLVYQRADGSTINLLVRPRWDEASSRLGKATVDDVSVLYWLDGPLAFAMTTNAAEGETEQFARAVREAVGRARLNDGIPTMARSPDAAGPTLPNDNERPEALQLLRPHPGPHRGDAAVKVN